MNIGSWHGGDREPAGRVPPPGFGAEFTSVQAVVTSGQDSEGSGHPCAGEGGHDRAVENFQSCPVNFFQSRSDRSGSPFQSRS